MPLIISDAELRIAGMSEREAKIEIASRWFDAAKLAFGQAAIFAGLDELQFEAELRRRSIPRYRYTDEMLEEDVRTLQKLGRW